MVTPAVPVTLVAGLSLAFIAGFTNTGAVTLNASGTGVKNVFKQGPAGPIPLIGGEIDAGNLVSVRYDGTRYQLTATDMGTAATMDASSNTGVVAAVSGPVTVGNIPAYTDTAGTLGTGRTPTAGTGKLVALQGAVTTGHLAVFDAAGSVADGGLPGVAKNIELSHP